MGKPFPVREKSGNLEQTGKIRENHTKYRITLGISDKYYLIFLVIFKLTVYCVLKCTLCTKDKTLKKILEKVLEKSANFVSLEKWELCHVRSYNMENEQSDQNGKK